MADENLKIKVSLRDLASRAIRGVRNNLGGMEKMTNRASSSMNKLVLALTSLATVYASGRFLKGAISTFAEFDDTMRFAGAVTKATAEEMTEMTKVAKELGATTRFTARQAADGYRLLGMAGFDAVEATEALPGVLNLAAAAQVEVAQAADITTNVLQAYGMEVEELSKVNDGLVNTFTSSNTTLVELGEAFKYVGPIAKGVGADFEELLSSIGKLGDAGLKGTLAGTALRGAINALLNPTREEAKLMDNLAKRMGGVSLQVKDSEGNFIGFTRIIEQLEAAGLRGDEALRLFGLRAGPGMAALLNIGSDAIRELTDETKASIGVTDEMQEKMEAGIGGAIRRSKAAWEGLKILIGETFNSATIDIIDSIAQAIRNVMEVLKDPKNQTALKFFAEKIAAGLKKHLGLETESDKLRNELGRILGDLQEWNIKRTKLLMEYNEELKRIEEKNETSFFKIGTDHLTKQKDKALKEIDRNIDALKKFQDRLTEKLWEINKPGGNFGYMDVEQYVQPVPGDKLKKPESPFAMPVAQTKVLLESEKKLFEAGIKEKEAILEREYAFGKKSLDQYYNERAVIIDSSFSKERQLLQEHLEIIVSEMRSPIEGTDMGKLADKYNKVKTQMAVIDKEYEAELERLTIERYNKQKQINQQLEKSQEKLNNTKLRMERAFQAQKERLEAYSAHGLESQHNKELIDLQTRQDAELKTIQDHYAAKLELLRQQKNKEKEIEQAGYDQAQAEVDLRLQQEKEKHQLTLDQQFEVSQKRLELIGQVAGATSEIFDSLFALTGRQNKELFRIAKALAIAEAIMNVAVGVTAALKTKDYVSAGIIAAKGAAQVATITAQSLAEGGEVKGHSPHSKADNIQVNATAGEFMQPVDSVKHYGMDAMEAVRQKVATIFTPRSFSIPSVKYGLRSFAEGGLVPAAEGGVPNIKVQLENRSSEDLEITESNVKYDQRLKSFVLKAVVDGRRRNVGGMRRM